MIDAIAEAAYQALRQEVRLTPKPGLVDLASCGAHRDMNADTFFKSADALRPHLRRYLQQGRDAADLPALFDATRAAGVVAEAAMLAATDGVNTHQGANFTFGFWLASLGWCLQTQSLAALRASAYRPVFAACAAMTQGRLMGDFEALKHRAPRTYGEKLYVEHGIKGIRGEAEAGYPLMQTVLLPFLAADRHTGDLRYWRLLLVLMQHVVDTNLIHRGGVSAWHRVQEDAAQLAALPDAELPQALSAYDQALIQRWLSPGGAADFLAMGYFFDNLRML